ncbi:hypothetical protein DRE_02171 [Drechslerella stenobrocha 248]|uniref:tRNA ligase n=1 Tax=Drechslerella stenobrocha 248 TaxID=1043628 RepID=W7I8K0_9PEZI|nr:hypothetical protein DRE_02171 [Drechslerella stenobrocha 248]
MSVQERYAAPFEEQDADKVNKLVQELLGAGKNQKRSFTCRKGDYAVEGSKLTVTSWRFQDWDYKKKRLPTNARGLFTIKLPNGDHRIVIRGYDKFFNTGEVARTEWSSITENTQGPYEVTMKENGCIIFVSGLPDGTLLVCSKHSTGSRGDVEESHSQAGEKWVDRQLEKAGKSREDFAKFLYNANVTAVAELCDDSFEEHILAYTGDSAGLYLHGVNLNLPVFATWSAPQVRAFADDWGFKKIETLEKQTPEELKTFLDGVAETGEWNGRAVEGFVIRCKARYKQEDPHWHDWFFKYKFEEPYLMYRQWREVTKQMISGNAPRYKKHAQITSQYLQYAREQIRKDPAIGKAFMLNHGIIAMRDGFLASKGTSGFDIIKKEEESGEGKAKSIVLVPIATLGCGKTTVALGLVKLFDCGHIQNDNITVKKGKPMEFARQIAIELNNHPIVIADRNNHQKRERAQLINDLSGLNPDVQFVALHYVHQRAGGEALKAKIREPDSGFDAVIELDPLVDSQENLETVIEQLYELYPHLLPKETPFPEEIDMAVESAISGYNPRIKHIIGRGGGGSGASEAGPSRQKKARDADAPAKPQEGAAGKAPKPPAVEYFGINLPTYKVTAALDQAFSTQPAEVKRFYTQLKNTRRGQSAFHITMAHRATAKKTPERWEHYAALQRGLAAGETVLDKLQVRLETVVWDSRVMAG